MEKVYKVSGSKNEIQALEFIMGWINYCSKIGHYGVAEIHIDGDGFTNIEFKNTENELLYPHFEDTGELFVPNETEEVNDWPKEPIAEVNGNVVKVYLEG